MPDDLVVDTNVLVHAENPGEERCNDSRNFLWALYGAEALVCVDKGFSLDDAQNRSFIGREYLDNVPYGSLAFAVVRELAQLNRIRFLEKRAPQPEQQRIEQMIYKTTDRVFLAVACNSVSRVLVSHDFEDFPLQRRSQISSELDVDILEACEVVF
jgi:hypothetical protein